MIAIKDMEMPKNCASCVMKVGGCKERIYIENRPDRCPLTEIKTDGDIISRQAAIDAIFSEPLYKSGMKKRNADVVVPAIYEKIKSLPSAQPEQRWIPVSERPPKEGQDVLITKEPFKIKGYEQNVIKAKRSVDPRSGKIEWWSPEFGTLTNKAVLAWKPLPKPYQEGEQEE